METTETRIAMVARQMRGHRITARKTGRIEFFIQCPNSLWSLWHSAWVASLRGPVALPCPMPSGHIMFDGRRGAGFTVPVNF